MTGPDPGGSRPGLHHDGVPARQRTSAERSRNDRARSGQDEDAVDPQPRFAQIRRGRGSRQHLGQRLAQALESASRGGVGGNDRRVRERGTRQARADRGDGGGFVGGQVDLGQGDDGAGDSEILEDLQVFFGLGHPAVVGRHHQQGQIDRADARDHVLHEILVAGNVDDAAGETVGTARSGGGDRQVEMREPEVDRDPPGLFLRQAIGIRARQSQDQRALPVVHVAGGGEDVRLRFHGEGVRR
jgi:hypothetical protein